IPLRPGPLAKVAPAVERPGIHLGVARHGDDFHVWGTTRDVPAFCLVVEVVASGLLVVKHRSEPFGKFVNVAVLEGDQVKVVDEAGGAAVPDCPSLVKSLLGFIEGLGNLTAVNVLVEMAASMRAHGRGGALLVVPADSTQWRESVVTPMLYAVDPPFTGLADVLKARPEEASGQHEWQEEVRRSIDAIAGLTAVDGATIINLRYELLALGAKISRRRGNPPVEQVSYTEPVEGNTRTLTPPAQLGGTRHLSAAQFVHDQRDASALVASQDGRFTIFKWSQREEIVHAHRVDALLL
ncbi:MAG: putative sensor domain DACNV-containing protein, partial [Vicinamibacteria bacterium]